MPVNAASEDSVDPIEEMLGKLLEGSRAQWASGLERLCRQHPDLEDALRTRYQIFLRLERGATSEVLTGGPKRFGDFVLVHELSRSDACVTHLALRQSGGLDRRVVLRRIDPMRPLDEAARERFFRDGERLLRLEHPVLPKTLEVGEIDGSPFLARQFIEGKSLHDHLAEASFPPWSSRRELIAAFCRLARGLHAAHEAGLIHEDLSPANVIVSSSGDPYLIGFAIGPALGARVSPYMTPEQLDPQRESRSEPFGRATDIHALGVTLFESLTRRRPFEGEGPEQLAKQILESDAPGLRSLLPDVDAELATVIEICLQKSGSRRYASALVLARELEQLSSQA